MDFADFEPLDVVTLSRQEDRSLAHLRRSKPEAERRGFFGRLLGGANEPAEPVPRRDGEAKAAVSAEAKHAAEEKALRAKVERVERERAADVTALRAELMKAREALEAAKVDGTKAAAAALREARLTGEKHAAVLKEREARALEASARQAASENDRNGAAFAAALARKGLEHAAEVERMDGKVEAIYARHAAELAEEQRRLEGAIEARDAAHAAAVKELEARHAEMVDALERTLEAEHRAAVDAAKRAEERHAAALALKEAEVGALKNQLHDRGDASGAALATEHASHASAVRALDLAHSEELESLDACRRADLDRQRSDLEAAHKAREAELRDQVAHAEARLVKVEARFDSEVVQRQNWFAESRAKLDAEHLHCLRQVEAEYEEQRASDRYRHAAQVDAERQAHGRQLAERDEAHERHAALIKAQQAAAMEAAVAAVELDRDRDRAKFAHDRRQLQEAPAAAAAAAAAAATTTTTTTTTRAPSVFAPPRGESPSSSSSLAGSTDPARDATLDSAWGAAREADAFVAALESHARQLAAGRASTQPHLPGDADDHAAEAAETNALLLTIAALETEVAELKVTHAQELHAQDLRFQADLAQRDAAHAQDLEMTRRHGDDLRDRLSDAHREALETALAEAQRAKTLQRRYNELRASTRGDHTDHAPPDSLERAFI